MPKAFDRGSLHFQMMAYLCFSKSQLNCKQFQGLKSLSPTGTGIASSTPTRKTAVTLLKSQVVRLRTASVTLWGWLLFFSYSTGTYRNQLREVQVIAVQKKRRRKKKGPTLCQRSAGRCVWCVCKQLQSAFTAVLQTGNYTDKTKEEPVRCICIFPASLLHSNTTSKPVSSISDQWFLQPIKLRERSNAPDSPTLPSSR